MPIRDGANYLTFLVEGRPPPDSGSVQDAEVLSVMPGYFDALGIPLRRGRLLDERDDAEGELVALISERLAQQYFPGQEAVDQRLNLGAPDGPWSRIVGVVGDTRHSELTDDPYPQIYFPLAQRPRRTMSFVVRTAGPPEELVPSLRQVIRERDPQLPLYAIGTFRQIVAEALAQPRFNLRLLGAFAFCALLLAGIGLYGILSYSIAQRRRELGLRMALGASGRRLVAEVARQSLVVAVAGLAVGVVGALLLGRWLSGLLFGVAPTDLVAYLSTVPVLLLVALLAAWLPARRASRVDPAIALREE